MPTRLSPAESAYGISLMTQSSRLSRQHRFLCAPVRASARLRMAPTELQLSDPRPRYAGPRAGVVDRVRTCPTPGVREQRGAHCCLQRRAPPRIACTPWKAVWPPAAGLALMNGCYGERTQSVVSSACTDMASSTRGRLRHFGAGVMQ
jgi:hypothetical protein